MPHQIISRLALDGSGNPGTGNAATHPTQAWLDAILERNRRKLEDLSRTVELLTEAEEAMTAVDIDRMLALADILRTRIAARAAERDALKAA